MLEGGVIHQPGRRLKLGAEFADLVLRSWASWGKLEMRVQRHLFQVSSQEERPSMRRFLCWVGTIACVDVS